MLNLFRRSPRRELPVLPLAAASTSDASVSDASVASAAGSCTLASCRAGSWAMVLEVRCGDQEACRLRALGLCEGAQVNVVHARNAVLLEVRGTRIALGRALGTGITVRPIDGGAAVTAPALTPAAAL